MSKKFIVGIDESTIDSRALAFAEELASCSEDTSIHIIHVLEWSPYSFLTAEELAERHKRRGEEMTRANDIFIAPVLEKLKKSKIKATGEVRYGGIAETISKCADDLKGDMIFINRTGEGRVAARVFGSVPGSLVQISKVPVIVVP